MPSAAMRRGASLSRHGGREADGDEDLREGAPRVPPADEQGDERRRRRRHRFARRIAGVIGSIITLLALPEDPDGTQAGVLSVVFDMSDNLYFAARAYEQGFAGYGDCTIYVPRGAIPDRSFDLVLNDTRRVIGRAEGAGLPLNNFYAGKTSLYGPDLLDPTQWFTESLARFRQHCTAAAGWKLSFVTAIYSTEQDALDVERRLIAELGGATGLQSVNKQPYRKGKLSYNADGYAVYIQAR